eukprot:gene11153-9725_t
MGCIIGKDDEDDDEKGDLAHDREHGFGAHNPHGS